MENPACWFSYFQFGNRSAVSRESCLLSFPPSLERGQYIQGTQGFEGEIGFLISFSVFQLLFTTVFNFKAIVTKQTYSERADLLIKQARNI